MENYLWAEDVTHAATTQLNQEVISKINVLNGERYSPFASISMKNNNNEHIVEKKIKESKLYQTNHPQPQHTYIPTPKLCTNAYSMSNWMSQDFKAWVKKGTKWEPPSYSNEGDVDIAEKWDEMVGKGKVSVK